MSSSTDQVRPLYSSLGGDPELGEIVDLFVEEMPRRVETLIGQLESSDFEGLRRTAHQLKGAAGSYGFDPISPRAAELERTIVGREPEPVIRQAVDELVNICNRARGGVPK